MRVRGMEGRGGVGGGQRGRIEDGKKARALQKAIPSAFVGLPLFHSLPLSFEGIFYSFPSLCLCPHFFSFFFVFYFMMFSFFFFFFVAVVSSGTVALFLSCQVCGARASSLSPARLHLGSVFLLRFDYPLSLLLPHSHPFPLTSSPP